MAHELRGALVSEGPPALPWSEPTLRALLASRGLRATRARLSLLLTLSCAPAPVTHGELFDRLRGELDRATLYRNLERLVDEGIVIRALFSERVARYELPHDAAVGRSHARFLCTRCGRVRRLSQDDVSFGAVRGAIDSVQITGVCETCLSHAPPCSDRERHRRRPPRT